MALGPALKRPWRVPALGVLSLPTCATDGWVRGLPGPISALLVDSSSPRCHVLAGFSCFPVVL